MTGRVEKRQGKPDAWDKSGRKEKGKRHFRVVLRESDRQKKTKVSLFRFLTLFPLLFSPVSISFAQQQAAK